MGKRAGHNTYAVFSKGGDCVDTDDDFPTLMGRWHSVEPGKYLAVEITPDGLFVGLREL